MVSSKISMGGFSFSPKLSEDPLTQTPFFAIFFQVSIPLVQIRFDSEILLMFSNAFPLLMKIPEFSNLDNFILSSEKGILSYKLGESSKGK